VRRFLSTIIVAALLVATQSSFGVIVSHKQGVVFRFHGHYYGVYDDRYADLVSLSDGKIVGGAYWSGVALGPLGQFGTSTSHPLVRENGLFVLAVAGVLGTAMVLRARGRRGGVPYEAD
jgi:hypothetical protein